MEYMLTIPLFNLLLYEEKMMVLGDLQNYDCCVEAHTLVSSLAAEFKRDPGLPGILI
jgi:hypothetical protein